MYHNVGYHLFMKSTLATALLFLATCVPAVPARAAVLSSGHAKAPQASSAPSPNGSSNNTNGQAEAATGNEDAFYYFMVGHLAEQDYEASNGGETPDASIEAYKKALELSPGSPVILERLAEIYAKSQQIRDAVSTAEEALQADPKSIDAHRLLAFIYYRALGDPNAGALQQENLEQGCRAVPGHSAKQSRGPERLADAGAPLRLREQAR